MTPHHILSSYFLLLLLFVSSTFASAVMKAVTKCTNEWMGSVSFTCGAGTMLHVEDAVHYSNDNPAKTWKAAGVKAACGRSPSCLIFFSIFWSGEQSKWIRCYKITYRCETVTCSKPEAPAFGSAKFSSIGLNSVVSYSCQEGYRLRGTPVSRCMHKGKYFDWSTPAPICEIAYDKCPSKSNSRHPMGSYGSVCYEFVLEEKTWGEADNNCRKRNGTLVSIASKDFLKTALLTTPALNMRSMWGYFWTAKNGNSECKLLVVNVEDAINHHYDTAEECQEKNNYICQYEPNLPKKCPLLETPPHGILDTHNDSIGTIVTHSCLAGYKLNGTSTRKCLPSGMWSKEKPHCVVHDCGPLVVADESGITSVLYNSTTYLSTAKYSCKSGYRILGIATRRCNGFGQWAGTQPKCERIPTTTESTTLPTTQSSKLIINSIKTTGIGNEKTSSVDAETPKTSGLLTKTSYVETSNSNTSLVESEEIDVIYKSLNDKPGQGNSNQGATAMAIPIILTIILLLAIIIFILVIIIRRSRHRKNKSKAKDPSEVPKKSTQNTTYISLATDCLEVGNCVGIGSTASEGLVENSV